MAQVPEAALASFTKLNSSVYISDPKNPTDGENRPLVVLAFWMNAAPRALVRYVNEYRRMMPVARIVIIRSTSDDFFFASSPSTQQDRLEPAVDALRTFAVPGNSVFIHLFSNGGVMKVAHLMRAFKDITGQPMPISSMIFDSAPGVATIESGMKALSFSLPQMYILRLISKLGLWLLLVTLQLFRSFMKIPNPMDIAREMINDKALFQPSAKKGLIRCYIYSEKDGLIHQHEVEDHIRYSESCGIVVRRERFLDSPHVGHMMMHPDRYWAIVRKYLKPSKSA